MTEVSGVAGRNGNFPTTVWVGEESEAVVRELSPFLDLAKHTCLSVGHDEPGFNEVLRFLATQFESQNGDSGGGFFHYAVLRGRTSNGDCVVVCSDPDCLECAQDLDEIETWEVDVTLAPSLTTFVFEDVKIWIYKRTEGPPGKTGCGGLGKYQKLYVFAPGENQISLLKAFFKHAFVEVNLRKKSRKTFSLHRWVSKHRYWRMTGEQPPREAHTLFLPNNMAKEILNDVEDFLSKDTRKWYNDRGIPYKRSFLLSGPPGCGKTSVVKMIASETGRNVCFLQPSGMSDESLGEALEEMPSKSILVLEDVDALFAMGRKVRGKNKVTFSGVLNALDGLISPQNGQLLVMTTNHPEKLDPAMIRSGRIDRRFELSHPTFDQAKRMFLHYYPEAAAEEEGIKMASNFAEACTENSREQHLSMAALQNFFILGRGRSPGELLENLEAFVEEEVQYARMRKSENGKKEKCENGKKKKSENGEDSEESSSESESD